MNRMTTKKTAFLWIGIALLGLFLYLLPVMRKRYEGFSTGNSSADTIAAELSQTLEEQSRAIDVRNSAQQQEQNQQLYNQFQSSLNQTGIDPLTGIQLTSENKTVLNPIQFNKSAIEKVIKVAEELNKQYKRNPAFTFSPKVQSVSKQQLPQLDGLLTILKQVLKNGEWNPSYTNLAIKVNTGDLLMGFTIMLNEYKAAASDIENGGTSIPFKTQKVAKALEVITEVLEYNKKHPTFIFSPIDTIKPADIKAYISMLEVLYIKLTVNLSNNKWEAGDDKLADIINDDSLYLISLLILEQYRKVYPSIKGSGVTGVLPLTESDRITVEILKQTLDEIQQLSQKYKSHTFKQSIKANVLIKKIPELEIKLSQVQKEGWDLSPTGKEFREAIKSGSLQKEYDIILEELKTRDADSVVQDMKDLWKTQTGKELPQEFESLQSSPGSCKITQQYVTTPSELQGCVSRQTKKITPVPKYKCPDMRDYIHKNKIPNLSDYIRKDSIPCWACKL